MGITNNPRVGVLALQGDFASHATVLRELGAAVVRVRHPQDLIDLDGVVLPGGESTTVHRLLNLNGLWGPLDRSIAAGLPTLGTCAGLILLARRVRESEGLQKSLGVLDVEVERNAYGPQVASFEAPVKLDDETIDFPGVFIRAPRITAIGSVRVIATMSGEVVGVRLGAVIGLSFHPELAGDARIHASFLAQAASYSRARMSGTFGAVST